VLHKTLLFCFVALVSAQSYADTQARILTGTKQQTFKDSSQTEVGSSPLGLIAFVDFEIVEKWYFSAGTSFEMDPSNFGTSGFTLYGSIMYYLYGAPQKIQSEGGVGNTEMELYYPYSIYASLGIFQKQIRLRREGNEISENQDFGGLSLGLGGNYNLNSRMYLSSHLQLLQSGRGTDLEYNSFELYAGIGFRL